MAFITMPFFGVPSLPGRSNSTTGTLALTQWAAICAPITPAPSTATFLTMKLVIVVSSSCLEQVGVECHQVGGARTCLADQRCGFRLQAGGVEARARHPGFVEVVSAGWFFYA